MRKRVCHQAATKRDPSRQSGKRRRGKLNDARGRAPAVPHNEQCERRDPPSGAPKPQRDHHRRASCQDQRRRAVPFHYRTVRVAMRSVITDSYTRSRKAVASRCRARGVTPRRARRSIVTTASAMGACKRVHCGATSSARRKASTASSSCPPT